MIDTHFFRKNKPVSLKEIARLLGAEIVGNDSILVTDVARLDEAEKGHVASFHNAKFIKELSTTKAEVIILHPKDQDKAPKTATLLLTPTPYRAFGQVAALLYQETSPVLPGIASTAIIHPTVTVPPNVCIEDFVVIHQGVSIGERVHIKSHTVIGRHVEIGDDTVIEGHVNIAYALIGKHVHIKPGAKIGQSGFGFHMDEKGPFPIPQLGRVLIGDRVEIGSNTTIDRGSQSDTVIGSGSRIDNLVQIAHNVKLGSNCIIVAQTGIAGSSELGNFVVVAGQVGIADHLKIGDGVRIAAQSGVMRNIEPKTDVAGSPCLPAREWHKQTAFLKKMITKRG